MTTTCTTQNVVHPSVCLFVLTSEYTNDITRRVNATSTKFFFRFSMRSLFFPFLSTRLLSSIRVFRPEHPTGRLFFSTDRSSRRDVRCRTKPSASTHSFIRFNVTLPTRRATRIDDVFVDAGCDRRARAPIDGRINVDVIFARADDRGGPVRGRR